MTNSQGAPRQAAPPRDAVISLPKALPGDDVSVENYRLRPPKWEHGEVLRAEYVISHGCVGSWMYTVELHRRDAKGWPMRRYVGNDQIERDDD